MSTVLQAFTCTCSLCSLHQLLEIATLNTSVLQMEKLRLGVQGNSQDHKKSQGKAWIKFQGWGCTGVCGEGQCMGGRAVHV